MANSILLGTFVTLPSSQFYCTMLYYCIREYITYCIMPLLPIVADVVRQSCCQESSETQSNAAHLLLKLQQPNGKHNLMLKLGKSSVLLYLVTLVSPFKTPLRGCYP